MEFLKNKIISKNEIICNLFIYNTQEDKALTKMHESFMTPPTRPLAEHVAQKIAWSVYPNQATVIKIPCIEVLRLS